MSLLKLFSVLSVLIVSITFVSPTSAQEAKSDAVYLDEPEVDPPARESRRQKVEDKYENGKVRFERNVSILSDDTYVNDGPYIEYYPDGQKFCEGNYVQGVMEGEWNYWHPNGELCKTITLKKGKPDGAYEVRRADGTLEGKQGFKNGIRDGEWSTYYADGKTPKVKANIVEGKVEGERTTYYENGQLRQQSQFKAGQLDGLMTEFDESGKKIAEATFKDGKVQGQVERFN
ncbi:MAG: toxin-antitoxin system YwqK family antitoxin [Bythopirellula sp.]|nr:toxin-antitoxin system YwqK family antitoxin [Bythopirellula sp.]